MKNTRGVYAGTATLALSAGLLFTASPAQAASTIDLPQPGGNTVQISGGQDVFLPQFSLWPLPPNTSDNKTVANTAIGRGTNTTGQAWLFGVGAGNVVQFATGGNIVAPQFAVGTNNNSKNTTEGNFAAGDGSGSVTNSQAAQGFLMDGNGNIFQVAFLQGNIIAPQVAVLGDNHGDQTAHGNWAVANGDGASTDSNDGFAFITGNGNIIQIEILSDNVIAPQLAVGGNNDIVALTDGNVAIDNGSGDGTTRATTNVTNQQNPLAGFFSVTGNGNVTHIAILSNNVWAPQIAPLGRNTSDIVTDVNDSVGNGNEADTTGDTVDLPPRPVVSPIRSTLNQLTGTTKRPVLDAIESVLPPQQFGNGNSKQTASGSGIIDNPQIGNVVKVKADAPVKVNPLVRDSTIAVPTTLAGDNKSSGSSSPTAKPSFKPGSGVKAVSSAVKKVSDGIKKALSPKKASSAE